jgi:methylmalonyl-CoA mutase
LKPGGIIEQLVMTLQTSASFLETVDDQHLDTAVRQIGFSINVGEKFFPELAKLKSLRYLWGQVTNAFGVEDRGFIHAASKKWIQEAYQPHGNMIKATTSAMAAICGGCDILTVEPENTSDATIQRIALNVSSVLREESFLNKVADPTAGSYFLESLVNELCEKAWAIFKAKVDNP